MFSLEEIFFINNCVDVHFMHRIPNTQYENFVNARLEAAVECIPTKQRAKPRVPWETLAVRKKRADVKTASKCNRKNPTNINALKLKKGLKWIS